MQAGGQRRELRGYRALKRPEKLIDINMSEPVQPVGAALVGVAGVCALTGLMLHGAVLAAPMLPVGAQNAQFRMFSEALKGGFIVLVKVEDKPVCAQLQVMRREAFYLWERGFYCADDTPFHFGFPS